MGVDVSTVESIMFVVVTTGTDSVAAAIRMKPSRFTASATGIPKADALISVPATGGVIGIYSPHVLSEFDQRNPAVHRAEFV